VDIGHDRDPWASGGFADVFRGEYSGQNVAVKRLRIHNEDKVTVNPVRSIVFASNCVLTKLKLLCKEALLWRQLRHPHVLEFFGVDVETFASRNSLCLVSLWMERGTLKEFIHSSAYNISNDRSRLVSVVSYVLHFQLTWPSS
jgi:serine/threonine protein kinase